LQIVVAEGRTRVETRVRKAKHLVNKQEKDGYVGKVCWKWSEIGVHLRRESPEDWGAEVAAYPMGHRMLRPEIDSDQ
jgi:hypothetical protein